MSSSKVFFIQKTKFDLTNAEKYGEVCYVLDHDVSPFNPSEAVLEIGKQLKLKKFNPEVDYIGFTGQSILLAYMFALCFAGYGEVRVLLYDARTGEYRDRVVPNPYSVL